jgi:hypothetical protein
MTLCEHYRRALRNQLQEVEMNLCRTSAFSPKVDPIVKTNFCRQ